MKNLTVYYRKGNSLDMNDQKISNLAYLSRTDIGTAKRIQKLMC